MNSYSLYALIFYHVLFSFIVLLKINFLLIENGENVISAQPRISAHLEYAPTLKVQKLNKRPGRLIE